MQITGSGLARIKTVQFGKIYFFQLSFERERPEIFTSHLKKRILVQDRGGGEI